MLFTKPEKEMWKAVIKTTNDKSELYLETLHRIEGRHYKSGRKRGKVVRE